MMPADGRTSYVLLNDQPVNDVADDLIGTSEVAEGLASMLMASRASSPFVLAVDASWGMGKSTLLRQIETRLAADQKVTAVRFNAWTTDGENALEGLIKSVLGELDRNVVRRWVRRLAKRQRLTSVMRLALALLARFVGVTRLVDELWKRLALDAKSRNELRDVIHGMLSDWVQADGKRDPDRALVVFIDDLDRCPDEVVIKVCEAVKLYLDAPGLIFVIACDQSVLARSVSAAARGGLGEGLAYLEKIVQVSYRVPAPEETQIKTLIRGYAEKSRTSELIDETVTEILAQRTSRNPRRIKRIINSFVLEYRLNPAWRQPNAGSQLVTAILLQQLYRPFYDLLISEEASEDLITEFLDYVDVRDRVPEPPRSTDDPWWDVVRRTFKAHRLAAPESGSGSLRQDLQALEAELPEFFPDLAGNGTFVALLRGVGDENVRREFRSHLIRRPLATQSIADASPRPPVREPFRGMHIVCVDDDPLSLDQLVNTLEALGATVNVHDAMASTEAEIMRGPLDVLISDVTRGDDPDAGFEHVARLRTSGYRGPVVFFTNRITPQRRQRARELDAIAIVNAEEDVIDALRTVGFVSPSPRHRTHASR
jgi:CheY-like chemotaxis protein